MILRKHALLCATLTLTLGVGSLSAQTVIGQHPEEQAARVARHAEAQRLVTQWIEQQLLRKADQKVIAADAKRIVASLSEAQVEALVGGEDLARLLAPGRTGEPVQAMTAASSAGLKNVFDAALGDSDSDLLFVPVPPCRILDTRVAGGPIAAHEIRSFEVVGTQGFDAQGGNPGGCGIPQGATTPIARSVVINFVAVGPGGPGHLEAWEFNQPVPTASVLNYAQASGLNIANGVIVPIAGVATADKDLNIRANINATFVVADVTGYFTRFPKEVFQGNLKSTVLQNDVTSSPADLGDGACHELNSCTVTADANGTIIVEAWGQAVVSHTSGTQDRMELSVETASTVACDQTGSNVAIYEVSSALGSNPDVDFVITLGRAYAQTAGTTMTYRLSGHMTGGASANDKIENSRLICTFIPD
jgi:hypothetical protein